MDSFSYSLSSADVFQRPSSPSHVLQFRLTGITDHCPLEFWQFQISQDCVLSRRKAHVCVYSLLWYLGINLSVSDFDGIVSCMYRGGGAEVGGRSVFLIVATVSCSRKDVGESNERMIFDAVPSQEFNCAICLDQLKGAGITNNFIQTQCNHCFHRNCLQKWMSNKKTGTPDCPLCRAVISSAYRL